MSLNVLSMMGLLLAVGMLVDNAVVVVESIYQYREKISGQAVVLRRAGHAGRRHRDRGRHADQHHRVPAEVFGEANDISSSSTQVAITMSIAHLASWLVAVSLVPMLSAKLPPPKFLGRKNIITRVRERYGRFITCDACAPPRTMVGLMALLLSELHAADRTDQEGHVRRRRARRMFLITSLNALYPPAGPQALGHKPSKRISSSTANASISRRCTPYYTEERRDDRRRSC